MRNISGARSISALLGKRNKEKDNMGKKYELGLVVGRFQPLHRGHMRIINKSIEECENTIVLIGSAQENGTPRNPLPYDLRKKMIDHIYGTKVFIAPLNDLGVGDSPKWGQYVLDTAENHMHMMVDTVYLGNDGERSHWFDGITARPKEVYVSRDDENAPRISSSIVRNLFIDNDNSDQNLDAITGMMGFNWGSLLPTLENLIKAANGYKTLLVIDMQNDFISGSLPNKAASDICDGIISLIKNGHYSNIIATLDTHKTQDYAFSPEGLHLPIPHCIEGTSGHEIESRIQDELLDHNASYFSKNTFCDMNLFKQYFSRFSAVGEIDVVGTCTDICVISNVLALKTAFPEKTIKVFKNLCAGSSPEAQEAALKVMANCQILIA